MQEMDPDLRRELERENDEKGEIMRVTVIMSVRMSGRRPVIWKLNRTLIKSNGYG